MMARILVSSLNLLALVSLLKSCAATQYNIYDDYLAISKDTNIDGSSFHRGVRSALVKLEISDHSTVDQIREQLEAVPKENHCVCNALNLLVKYEMPTIAEELVHVLRSILAQIRLAKKGDKLEVVGRNLLDKIVAPKLRQRALWLREHYTKLYSDLAKELDAFFAAGLKVKQTRIDFVALELNLGLMFFGLRSSDMQSCLSIVFAVYPRLYTFIAIKRHHPPETVRNLDTWQVNIEAAMQNARVSRS
jgi:hypothetical protein